MRRKRFLVSLIALGLVCGWSGCAHLLQKQSQAAKKRVVVLGLSSPSTAARRGKRSRADKKREKRNAAVVKKIVATLAPDYAVIPAEEYWLMAERARAESMSARDVARVAGYLRADAVVVFRGKLARRSKRRAVLKLQIRDGFTGKTAKRYRIKIRGDKLTKRGKRTLEGKFLADLDQVAGLVRPTQEPPGTAKRRNIASQASEQPKQARRNIVGKRKQPSKPAPQRVAVRPQVAKRAVAKPAKPVRTAKPVKAAKSVKRAATKPRNSARRIKPAAPDKPKKRTNTRERSLEDDQPLDLEIEYDDRGQVIDDEVPPDLK